MTTVVGKGCKHLDSTEFACNIPGQEPMTHAGPDDYVLCASWVLGPLFAAKASFT